MVYRRSYRRRAPYRRTYRRRRTTRRVVKRAFRKAAYKKAQVCATYATLRTVVDVTTGASGDFTMTVNFNGDIDSVATAPQRQIVTSYADSTATQHTLQDASAYTALFESKRVRGVRIRYIPSSPDDPSSATSYQPLYLVYDRDGNTDLADSTPAVNDILEENKFTIKQLYRPFDIYRRSVPYKLWSKFPITTDASSRFPAGIWNTATFNGTFTPHWFFAIRDATASKNYGKFVIDVYLTFKDRV